jgi:hypothetical protein
MFKRMESDPSISGYFDVVMFIDIMQAAVDKRIETYDAI